MLSTRFFGSGIAAACLVLCALPVAAQSFKVQCPTATPSHPSDPANPAANPVGGRIKCQQISGGDGFATMGDGTRSEEHTSELQSHSDLVCRLLLEKKKIKDTGHRDGGESTNMLQRYID